MIQEYQDAVIEQNYKKITKSFAETVEPTLDKIVDDCREAGYYSHRCPRPEHLETIMDDLWGGDLFVEKNSNVFFRVTASFLEGSINFYAFFKDDQIQRIIQKWPTDQVTAPTIE